MKAPNLPVLSDEEVTVLNAAFGPPQRFARGGEYILWNVLRFDTDVLALMKQAAEETWCRGIEVYEKRYVVAVYRRNVRFALSTGLVDEDQRLRADICAKALSRTSEPWTLWATIKRDPLGLQVFVFMMLIASVSALFSWLPMTVIAATLAMIAMIWLLFGPSRARWLHVRIQKSLYKIGYLSDAPAPA